MQTTQKPKLPTVHDVAALAQVAPATVSRVFDPKWEGKVRPATREKVMQAAKALGYTPNAIARSLYMNRTNIVAVVVGKQIGMFYSDVFFELSRRIQASGRQVLVFSADAEKGVDEIVTQVHQYRVDAIVILGNATSAYVESVERHFVNFGTPVILFDRMSVSGDISSVCSDNIMGAKLAADFLMENGHQKIAYISGDANTSQSTARSLGFTSRVNELGGQIVACVDGDFTYQRGFRAMAGILSGPKVDAVFCADDSTAMGAMDAARAAGLSAPEDISIMGFDDNPMAALPPYALTTVRHPLGRLYDAVLLSLDRVLSNPKDQQHLLYPMEIVARGSVKLCR